MRARTLFEMAVVVSFAAWLAGCGHGSRTPLPDLAPPARPTLSEAEQAEAIRELSAKGAHANADGAELIEVRQ